MLILVAVFVAVAAITAAAMYLDQKCYALHPAIEKELDELDIKLAIKEGRYW